MFEKAMSGTSPAPFLFENEGVPKEGNRWQHDVYVNNYQAYLDYLGREDEYEWCFDSFCTCITECQSAFFQYIHRWITMLNFTVLTEDSWETDHGSVRVGVIVQQLVLVRPKKRQLSRIS